jgi:hypothetical protein
MKLLAPNGKPTNLAPEQYKLVRTHEFKEWFGDWENNPENSSKAVDKNGEPLILFHGSNINFNIFKSISNNLFFSDNKEVANSYRNKYVFKEDLEIGINEKYYEQYKDDVVENSVKIYEVFLNIRNPKVKDFKGDNWLNNTIEKHFDKNNDGFIAKNIIDGGGIIANTYVAFHPNQVKLSDGTNTTFDTNNPDIRFDNGGEVYVNKKTYKKWKSLVNMSKSELEKFYNSEEGKEAGLTASEAKEKGIDSGRESARWIMKMKDISNEQWTPNMWRWAKKQIRFISRMRGNKGSLYDKKGNKTRKHTSLLIWGHNPEIYKFENGGQILIAPNGVESNLNTEQYKLVRTPLFKKWFGDWENDSENSSKVLDENGEPMVCFHGTNREFNIFDSNEIGQGSGNLGHYGYGFYFSEDIREAQGYGSNILKCFLNIKNPFLHINKNFDLLKKHGFFGIDEKVAISIDFNDFYNKIALIDSKAYEFTKIAKEKGLDNVWDIYLENNSSSDSSIDLNSLYDILSYTDLFKQNDYKVPDYVFTEINEIGIELKLNYDYEFEQSLHWVTNLGENSKQVTNVIKSLGFDGIIVGSEFVLFESSQIKLADGSNITFNESNPDIRFYEGGVIKNYFKLLIKQSKKYNTPIDADLINLKSKKGHALDNIPKNTELILIDSSLFEKEKIVWGKVSDNKIAYHDRDSGDKYWNKEIDNGAIPPVLLEYDEYNSQLRVRDGNHRLNVYLSKNVKKIPSVLTINAKKYLDKYKFENGGIINKDNFYKNTFANFNEISENVIPDREPNFISDWNSKYWYEGDYVIRQSDHWGKMDTCIWLLDNLSVNKLTQAKCKLSDFKFIEDNTSFENGGQINKQLMEKAIIENIIINPNEEYSEFVNEKAIDYVLLFPKYQNLTKEEALFIYKYFGNYENIVDKNGNYIALIQWNYVYGSNNKDAKKEDELLRKFIEKMDKHGIIVFDYYNSVIEADKAVIDFVNEVRDRIKSIVSNVINKNNDSDLEELNLLIELTEDTLKENKSDEELQMYLELLKDTKSELMKSSNTKFEEGGVVDKETWEKWTKENLKGIPLYDSTIYAFHEDKIVGFISNSWNVPELFVRPEYQKLGIGTELLWQYLIQDNGYFMDTKGFLGQYTLQGIIAIKKLHSRFVEEVKGLV